MIRFAAGRAVQRARRWLLRRTQGADDRGFILLESIIAIAVITVVMGAVGAEFVSGMISTSQQRAQQTAVQLADSAMEQIRALHPSDLVTGRDSASVTTQFNNASATVKPWLAQMDKAVDSTAAVGSGPNAAIPTTPQTQTPGTVAYKINEYLGWCSIRSSASATTDCVPPSTLGAVSATPYLRAVVSASWVGTRCGSSACTYVTSTLISTVSDRTFRINTAPYTAPVIVALDDQDNAVNDTVSLQLQVQDGTGVPSFTWAVTSGSLPTGLALSPTGLISGTITGSAGSYSATIQVTDAFLRTDTAVVTWTVKPPVTLNNPGPQATLTTQTVNLTLTAAGGDGAPYTYAVVGSSLPPGLALSSAGVISGQPTVTGNYTVQIKVFDKTGTRFGTDSFGWSISYPPLAASNPGTQIETINNAIDPLQLTASGGSGSYGWSNAPSPLPAGLSISASGNITGTPTATGTTNVVLTVTDTGANPVTPKTKTVSFTWNVVARPSVTGPGTLTVSVGAQLNLQLATTCPNSPCTYSMSGGPTGVSVSNSGVVTGTVGGSATTYSSVTITVTDNDGATTTTPVFTVIVKAKPTVAAPGTQTDTLGVSASVQITTTCPNSPCTYAITNGPTGLSVNSTGLITGTVGGSAGTLSNVTVTVTDNSGVTATTSPFTWRVYARPTVSSGAQADTVGASANDAFTTTCPNSPCTYTLSNAPTGLSVNGSGVVTGTVPSPAKVYAGVTVTVTDNDGVSSTSGSFSWTISAAPTLSGLTAKQIGETSTPSIPISYTCPASPCTIAFAGTLATASSNALGIGLNASAVDVAANSSRSLSVSAASGTIYLNGRLSTSAVTSGTSATYGVNLTITDANSFAPAASTSTWTAYSTPTISSPGVVTTAQLGTPTQTLTYICPTTSCTVAVTGLPSGIGISSTTPVTTANSTTSKSVSSGTGSLYLNGKVSGTATRTTYQVTVTITFSTTSITSVGTWTVS